MTESKCLKCKHRKGVDENGRCAHIIASGTRYSTNVDRNDLRCCCVCTYAQPEPATTPLTDEELTAFIELEKRATPGPWTNQGQVVVDENSITIGDESYNWRFVAQVDSDMEDEDSNSMPVISPAQAKHNADFIAAARNISLRLVERAQELEAVVIRLARCTCPDTGRYGHYDNAACNLTIARAALVKVESVDEGEKK